MAVREVLKYPSVESVTLVELDPAMTKLFSEQPTLVKLNGGALKSPKVKVVNTDAFAWLEQGTGNDSETFDVIIVDFPDPPISPSASSTPTRSTPCWTNASPPAVTQSFKPHHPWLLAKAIGRLHKPLNPSASPPRLTTRMCQTLVNGASSSPAAGRGINPSLYLLGCDFRPAQPAVLFDFPLDMARVPTEVNRLSNQVLVTTYEDEWGKVAH